MIEMLFAMIILSVLLPTALVVLVRQGWHIKRYTTAAELNETAIFASSEIRTLIKTAVVDRISACGKRITLLFGKNQVEVYPKNRSLLVKQREIAV
ncbi:MAG TPA: hypothetical protein VLH40_06890 [Atribacteraceae bacterium]|nr:hypothetical protein [Atribacteraceae bacterium]